MTHTNSELQELRRLAHRYGISLDLVDRLTLRPREVARVTGFSLLTVHKWIDSGELEVIQAPRGPAVPPFAKGGSEPFAGVRILAVLRERLQKTSTQDAHRESYPSRAAFFAAWHLRLPGEAQSS